MMFLAVGALGYENEKCLPCLPRSCPFLGMSNRALPVGSSSLTSDDNRDLCFLRSSDVVSAVTLHIFCPNASTSLVFFHDW